MTNRQNEIAYFIDRFWEENWTSPTVREICRETGLSSPSTVYVHLKTMVERGILERKQVGSRVLYRRPRTSSWPMSKEIAKLGSSFGSS